MIKIDVWQKFPKYFTDINFQFSPFTKMKNTESHVMQTPFIPSSNSYASSIIITFSQLNQSLKLSH